MLTVEVSFTSWKTLWYKRNSVLALRYPYWLTKLKTQTLIFFFNSHSYPTCYQCFSVGSSLEWGLEFWGLSIWNILELMRGGGGGWEGGVCGRGGGGGCCSPGTLVSSCPSLCIVSVNK